MDQKEYKPLILPVVNWNKKTLSDKYGELIVQPLEPGFGFTLGNALRRMALASVEGSAVTSVIIKGINNEFSSLPGVEEDAMQVILNIKQIVIRNKEGKPGKMHLSIKGEKKVTVADIQPDAHLELINKDHVIAHVVKGGELDIEFYVETGRGYQAAQWPADKALQADGKIYIDAMFSPVRNVTFNVEKTRVGGEIDYDKLTLMVETDGSEKPEAIVHYSVSVLRTQAEPFLVSPEIPFNEISKVPGQDDEKLQKRAEDLGIKGNVVDFLLKPIDELELSVRAHNCLINAGIKRVIDLVNLSEEEGLKIKNFGRKSLNEVKDSLKAFGLSFGMNIEESDLKKLVKAEE